MDGIFVVYKPRGITSHDVVYRMRKILNMRKIGHGGTLDPMAEGVLPVFTGKATRLLEYALEGEKTYQGVITFGAQTTTGDAEGEVLSTSPVVFLKQEMIDSVLRQFTGPIMQVPPMYSAIKQQGQPLYKLARKGVEVDREARVIIIHSLKAIAYDESTLTIEVNCSKGTYIRKLAEDIALACNMRGHLTKLVRTQVGEFTLAEARTLEEIATDYTACVLPLGRAVQDLPLLVVNNLQGRRIAQGVPTTLPNLCEEGCIYRVETRDGILVGTGKCNDGRVRALKVINIPEEEAEVNESN